MRDSIESKVSLKHFLSLFPTPHLLFFIFVLSITSSFLFFTVLPGGVPRVAHAAPNDTCQKLMGVTGVVPVTVTDGGKSYTNNNSGQNFFDGSKPSVDKKDVFVAPDLQAACSQKVGDTVYLKGWFWNDNLGWISLYCPGDGGTNRGIACGFVHYGVTIDKDGAFSGYAWSAVGWIRVSCKHNVGYNDVDYCATSNHNVTVEEVNGQTYRLTPPISYAWSDAIGWFIFDDIKVPWTTLPDECKDKDINKCLREGDNPLVEDEIVVDPPPGGGGVVLVPGMKAKGDDFPVGWNKMKILGNFPVAISSGGTVSSQSDSRNVLFRNVTTWSGVASRSCGDSGGNLTKFTSTDEVFYCKGDVRLDASANNWKGNKTIIVEDGNVYIENSLYSDAGQFGIIALRKNFSSSKNGNVYVGPLVREMRVQIYADGSVLPMNSKGKPAEQSDYAITSPDGSPTLFGQLFIRGMIISGNTSTNTVDPPPTDPPAPLPATFALNDLAALRSVPLDPGSKTPIRWNDYLKAIGPTGGTYLQYKVDPKTGAYLDDDDIEVAKLDDAGKKQISVTKVDPSTIAKFQKDRMFDANRVTIDPKNADDLTLGVILQFEPPSPNLGVFEGIRGNSFRQTR